jgi:hypothetical protein
MIFICFTNVLFPDSPAPSSNSFTVFCFISCTQTGKGHHRIHIGGTRAEGMMRQELVHQQDRPCGQEAGWHGKGGVSPHHARTRLGGGGGGRERESERERERRGLYVRNRQHHLRTRSASAARRVAPSFASSAFCSLDMHNPIEAAHSVLACNKKDVRQRWKGGECTWWDIHTSWERTLHGACQQAPGMWTSAHRPVRKVCAWPQCTSQRVAAQPHTTVRPQTPPKDVSLGCEEIV